MSWQDLLLKLSQIIKNGKNDIDHKHISCRGVPYIVVVGGRCVIGDNFTMNNGVRFNPIGYPQPCMLVVTKGAVLTIGENVGISQTAIICHHSITIGDDVKIGGGVKIYDTNFHSLNPEIRRNRELDMKEKSVVLLSLSMMLLLERVR